jgi:cytochrome c556
MKMTNKAILVTMTALVTVAMTATVLAQGRGRPNPDQGAVHFRQSLMTVIGGTAFPMILMQRGRMPYHADVVAKDAANLTTLAGMIPDAFERNTSHAQGLRTMAKPMVWENHEEFVMTAMKLKQRAEALEHAAKGGSEADVKSAIMNVGAVCNECHMKFRKSPPGGE